MYVNLYFLYNLHKIRLIFSTPKANRVIAL